MVIKTPFSDLPEDSKYLKLIWMNTKREDRVFIQKNQRIQTQKDLYINS